jgi:hypothetical protein
VNSILIVNDQGFFQLITIVRLLQNIENFRTKIILFALTNSYLSVVLAFVNNFPPEEPITSLSWTLDWL